MPPLTNLLREIKYLRIYQSALYMTHLKKLQRNKAFYKAYGIRKKVWQPLSYEDIKAHSTDLPWLDRDVTETDIRNKPGFSSFAPYIQEGLLQWNKNGFIHLPAYWDVQRIDALERSVINGLSRAQVGRYQANRLLNLHQTNPQINSVFRDPSLLQLLSFILGREVVPHHTINFYKSSSQPAHSDSMYLTTEPIGYIISVWIPLEDIVPGSGELLYYPGSHRLPYVFNKDLNYKPSYWKINRHHHFAYEAKVQQLIEEHQLRPEHYLPRRGDMLIWHANLLHGGSPRKDESQTRKSLVMHYFARGVLCYHESTGRAALLE